VWYRTEQAGREVHDAQSHKDCLGIMQTKNVPIFDYHLANPLSMQFRCVEMDGKIIHKINNINEFYHEFGYTPDMMKAGVLPEEYIWDKYIQNSTYNFMICIQIRIIQYLIKHSEEYCEQCKIWLDTYLNESVAETCSHCGIKHVCE